MLDEIGIVGNAAAEIAIRHLAIVDPPIGEALDELEVGELAECPQGLAGRRLGLLERRHRIGVRRDIGPITPALDMIGIDPEQIRYVAEQPADQRQA